MSEEWQFQRPPDYHPSRQNDYITGHGADWSHQSNRVPGAKMVYPAPLKMRYAAGVVDWVAPAVVEWILFQGHLAALVWVYYIFNSIWLQGRTGQSIGKKVCGNIILCHVMNDDDQFWSWYCYPGIVRCAWRFCCHIFDLVFPWGFLLRPWYNGRSRTYADTFASTSVYKARNLTMWSGDEAWADREAKR